MYHGRNRTQATRRTATPESTEKFNLSKNVKRYFKKFLKQTAVTLAIVLIVYITSVAAPNFWAQVSLPVRNALEHNIDFVAIYNGSIGRLFPNIMINVDNDYEFDDENEMENQYEYDNEYDIDYDYNDYSPDEYYANEIEDNEYIFVEAFEVSVL